MKADLEQGNVIAVNVGKCKLSHSETLHLVTAQPCHVF